MSKENLIPIIQLCTHYELELSFFGSLHEIGLIEIEIREETQYISLEKISEVEKMIRIHRELGVNIEAIDVVFNLLKKIEVLQEELTITKNRLRIYEEG